ncbi:unnamed protein product [Ceutorhynchus assimilis]|uniref:SAM-dependent MTase RsmB/NOP-type domain-containing protein n=1 Tax=Ceutorhynchus assimilis TaxID=467358 RepID=A0A9N9MNK7_9CUCU|nr:unnamed protein product [Ceutorhynchus assimilis]
MPYPTSPFEETFNQNLITGLKDSISSINPEDTLKWLCTAPTLTSYRVNTSKTSQENVYAAIQTKLSNKFDSSKLNEDIILIKHNPVDKELEKHPKEVIVDVDCAAAVLRGAHIYAPGVLGMTPSNKGDRVSIYADLNKKCLRGLIKPFTNLKLFIANGIVQQNRQEIFQSTPKGLAIEISETISGCPILPDNFLPNGWALLQNIPSIFCVKALNPQPNEVVLDMCAAPGNKTTHIAALMQNQGLLIALDKTPNKVKQLMKTCEDFGAKALVFQANSCHIVSSSDLQAIENGPPFAPKTFDRILLDAPCSVLGKRPQFTNKTSEKIIKSFIPLQRKLFTNAVALLKPQGTLVYSTCTITLAENEGLVAWALRSFQDLSLVGSGGDNPGWPGAGLTEEQRNMVQRFGPGQTYDSVGFFVACFVKNK